MSIFKRTNYADIGKTASVDQFSQAFRDASRRKKRDLIKGAVEAFRAGHPENIQEALSESQLINADVVTTMLRQLTEGKDDKAAVIDSAFAKATEDSKKIALTRVLRHVIQSDDPAEESFVAALLKSGADANFADEGYAGSLLAWAVLHQSHAIRDLLFENGASAEGALRRANARSVYSYGDRETLRGYQAKTAKPAAAPEEQSETEQLRQEVRALAEKVDRVLSLIETSDADQPEETKPPATKLKLRTVNNP